MITAIVTADRNWGIGRVGSPITTIPDDEKYIAAMTAGKTVIMGRKTYDGVLKSKLVGRTNIVLSKNPNFTPPDAIAARTVEAALGEAAELGNDIYVLGGESTFAQLLEYCDEVQVTAVDYVYDTDSHFPNLDKLVEWVKVLESEEQTHFDTVFHYRKYIRRKEYRM